MSITKLSYCGAWVCITVSRDVWRSFHEERSQMLARHLESW